MILTDQNYVDKAEQVIDKLSKTRDFSKLTTSQIRKILSLTSALYDLARMKPYENLVQKVSYLRVQIAYQSGRQPVVKQFVDCAQLLEALKEVHDKDSLILFCRYMEALVAYFKFNGGKEN